MKKPIWAEATSLIALISTFVVVCAHMSGCMDKTPEYSPKPTVTVTILENSEKLIEVQVHYENHGGWAKVIFSTKEDAKHYRKQLEFAVVKLRESEEKMKNIPKKNNAKIMP